MDKKAFFFTIALFLGGSCAVHAQQGNARLAPDKFSGDCAGYNQTQAIERAASQTAQQAEAPRLCGKHHSGYSGARAGNQASGRTDQQNRNGK